MNEIKERYTNKKGNKIFFTSDTHFFDEFMVRIRNPIFFSVEEMNDILITNWNKVVKKDDIIYHLGDVGNSMHNKEINIVLDKLLSKLNGHKHLIFGNHDFEKKSNFIPDYLYHNFKTISHQEIIEIGKDKIYLNHFPYLCFPGTYTEHIYQLYGHVHTIPNMKDYTGLDKDRMKYIYSYRQYDVGVDFNNFTPITWEEIKNKLNTY